MKKLLASILCLCLIFTATVVAVSTSVSADDYTLVWSDEFDGAGVNPWNWTLDQGVRNGERQTYKIDNASVHDGTLDIFGECTVVDKNGNVMPAGQVSNNTKDVRSASIEGSGKQAFKFGMVEVRAKLPTACSSWPAFWTCGWDKYGEDSKQGGSNWPACGEIDFMEMMCVNSANETVSPFGKTNKDKEYEVHLHCGPKGAGKFRDIPIDPGNIYSLKNQPLGYEWHTYGMIWEENQIQFTMDGVVRITVDTSDEALLKKAAQKCGGTDNEWYKMYKTQLETKGNPFNDFEHYFLLNYAIGGAGTEYRFYSDEWPQHLLIDYIRVYQKPNSGATHNTTLFDSYNYWYGKGLVKGAEMAQNWIDDPVYGGQKTEDSGVVVGTTQATVSTTSSGQVVTNTTASGSSSTTTDTIIDWDTNTNYHREGSTLTVGTDSITAVKSSGANLITSTSNNIAPYDGLKFSVTPNSGNEKTAVVIKVDGVSKSFALGSGTTECSLTFDELGVTPTSNSTIFFGAEGDGAANLTIGNVYGFTGTGSSETPSEPSSSQTLAASDIKLADLGNNVQIHTDLQQSALDDKTENILQYARGAEELSHPKAITLSWTSSVSGTYTVKISENSNLSDGKTYTTTSKSLSLNNLKIGTKYYWQVSCGSSVSSTSSFTTSSSAPRNLHISKVTNCRDIGGWSTGSGSVKQGLLYRTAKLDSISDTGKSTMLDDLGIKTEIDLRETTETGVGLSALGSSVKYCNVAMVNGGNRLTGNKEKVNDVFAILADKNNYPIVFHCSAGADRTGLIAFLVNGLLGVSESDLVRDFSFTNFGNIGGSRGHDALNDYLPKIKTASGSTLAEQMYNYLVNDTGVSASYLDSVISILSGNTVMPTVATSKTTTTTTTTSTTANGGSTGGTTASGTVIDWDVNTNFWAEGSTLTVGTDSITAVKSSGAKLITSYANNIAPYDGLKFSVTPNSGNEKTAVVIKVDGVSKSFALGSGTTECSVTFDELGVTPTSNSTIFFGAEGDGAANLTIGNVYGFTGTGSSETPTESSTLTPVETESTTSGSSSDTPTPSGAMIDWDINNNWYVVSGSNNETNVITNDNSGIRVYSYGSGRIIGTYNNDTTNFDGVKFTAIAPDPTNTSGLRVQIDGVETEYITLSSSATTFTLDFAELGVTPSSKTEINFEVNGVIDVLISDIEGYTTSGEEEKPSETEPSQTQPSETEPSQTQPSDTDSDVLVDWSTKDNWWNDGSVTTDNATDGFVKATTIASSNKNIIGTYNIDLSNYDGILFTAKGSGALRIKIGSYEGFGGTASKYLRLSDTEKTFNINFEACSVETTNTEFVLQVEAGSVDIIISDVIGYNLDDKTTSYSVTIDGTTLQNTSAFI